MIQRACSKIEMTGSVPKSRDDFIRSVAPFGAWTCGLKATAASISSVGVKFFKLPSFHLPMVAQPLRVARNVTALLMVGISL